MKIMEKAKCEGKWKQGLDSNNDLFEKMNNEAKKRIKELIAAVSE